MNDLTIVYKNIHSNNLYTAHYDGSKWYGNNKISVQPDGSNLESHYNPGATVFNNWLYILCKSANSNDLYVSWYDGNQWSGNVKISDMNGDISPESNYCPNIVVYKGLLCTVYKGANSNTLYAAWFDGTTWYGNKKISDMPGGISPESNYNPSMAIFNNQLYIVYKDVDSNSLYTATFDGEKWSGNTKIQDQGGNISPKSNYTPSIALFNNKLYLIYKDAHSNTLYLAWYDGSQWHGNTAIKDQDGNIEPESNYCPSATVYDGRLYITYKGPHANTLYSAWYDGSQWHGNIAIKDQDSNIDLESNFSPSISISAIIPAINSDWMSDLSDNVLISELNIPGSHCAAAINTWTKTPYACHNYSITDQLKYGIRLLDVRLYISQDGDTFKFITCHGDISIFGLHKYQSLSSLLDECKAYLGDHRRETVLISLQVDDWSNTSNEGAALTALHDLLSDYPTTAQKSIPKLGDIRGKIFLYNRINNDLNLGTPIKWVHNTVGSYADSSSSRSYKIYVQDRYKGLDERDVDKEKFDLVKDAFLHKKNGEVVWNFASATWCVILGVYIMNKLLNYFGANPAPDRLATFGWTLFDYSFNHYPTDTYGDMNIVELIISSNSNPRYKKYNKEFKVIE